MTYIKTVNIYDLYIGTDKKEPYYNAVPTGSPPPKGGYYSKEFIIRVKNLPKGSFD
jgi:hypothetical protein